MTSNATTSQPTPATFDIRWTRDRLDVLDLRYGLAPAGSTDGAKRFVVFLNGRTEWIEKYADLPERLQLPDDAGFLTWDHRGQGGSGGARSHVEDYARYAEDAAQIIKEAVGDKPYVLMGHSMGSLIGLYATLTGYLKPETLVLASPLLGMPPDPVPHGIARPAANLLHTLKLGTLSTGAGSYTTVPFPENKLTHDAERYTQLQSSPYLLPGVTYSWVRATFRATDLVFEEEQLKKLKTPTMVVTGSDERVVDPSAMTRWVDAASRASSVPVTLRTVVGARHELFSEIPAYADQASEIVRTWIATHFFEK